MDKSKDFGITAAILHMLAMALMLCDHMWALIFPAQEWMTCVGRIAFPIFAFMIVEGYHHTRNLRRYMLRLLTGAVVSEVPFNLMCVGGPVYPFHQNVMWTFLIGLAIIALIEKARERLQPVQTAIASAVLALFGFLAGYAVMADYYGAGVLTVLVFYFFRKRTWQNFLCQFVCLYVLNVHILGGYYYALAIGGVGIEIVQQGLALLALIPIWLYRGRQGFHSRAFQIFCYAFYPIHMVLLFLIRTWLLQL